METSSAELSANILPPQTETSGVVNGARECLTDVASGAAEKREQARADAARVIGEIFKRHGALHVSEINGYNDGEGMSFNLEFVNDAEGGTEELNALGYMDGGEYKTIPITPPILMARGEAIGKNPSALPFSEVLHMLANHRIHVAAGDFSGSQEQRAGTYPLS